MLKAVFFDLDGTLLPVDEDKFIKVYFKGLYEKVAEKGYTFDELVKVIWAGTKLMCQNDGKITNEEVFWAYFKSVYGESKLADKVLFDDFYVNEFKQVKAACDENPYAKDIISFCKENSLDVILSTNPIFPYNGTATRMGFVGLKPEDFKYVTAYENSSYAKPNPMYFKDLLEKFNLKPEEVILFGNNEYEDAWCAKQVGIKCILVGDYIIKNPNSNDKYPHIQMSEVINKIKENM